MPGRSIIRRSMHRIFVETSFFQRYVDNLNDATLLSDIQNILLKNPSEGDIIAGTGGVRKLRVRDISRGKGKRGGFRVLYLDLPERKKNYLLLIFRKNESEDISPDEKKEIRALVSLIKKEAR
ncbi:MAG: type II toxin-antitoxin system RelE/ParE family toxin [Nitrospirae bacterium]|nr:type II toxin-antitoxin system RelE/ParE family toxin [Nitrospirota bacterium]